MDVADRGMSRSFQDQAISAMKFFATTVLARPDLVRNLPRPRRHQPLPAVRSKVDVLKLINAVDNPKHRALLMVMYSAGSSRRRGGATEGDGHRFHEAGHYSAWREGL